MNYMLGQPLLFCVDNSDLKELFKAKVAFSSSLCMKFVRWIKCVLECLYSKLLCNIFVRKLQIYSCTIKKSLR